jgi:RNA polymerase sigma-70 factor (ECF subfamily)
MVAGYPAGLAALEALADEPKLARYMPFHATHARFLERLGRTSEARSAYARALGLATNAAERRFLERRTAEVMVDG